MNETDKTMRALPEVWPGWETMEKLGSGSFGSVYKIRRVSEGYTEYAAVKHISIPKDSDEILTLRKNGYDDESITERFREESLHVQQEYRLMSELKGNTNIVDCDDVRSVAHADGMGNDLYIKMELLTPLEEIPPEKLTPEAVVKLGCDLCTALELCEKNNIIHRDIKPANIFASKNGDYKLGDFGVSRIMESSSTNGGITGTPRYMAPEVYANQKYGHAADIYSLGLVLYWLLNEQRTPFQPLPPAKLSYSGDQEALNRRMKGEQFPPPKNGSEELKKIVLKACAYNSSNRFASAKEMRKALLSLSNQPISLDPPKPNLWPAVAILLLSAVLIFAFGKKDKSQPPVKATAAPVTYSTPAPTPKPSPTPTPHVHSWSPANCTRPAKCTICGEEQGSALGHSWMAATYERPRTCSVCGETQGDPQPQPTPESQPATYSHSSSSPVDYFTENQDYSQLFGVRVAHTKSLKGSKIIVQNLRDSGYNAYVYQIYGRRGYGILIGAFESREDAENLTAHIRKIRVAEADMKDAYVTKVYLSSSAVSKYADYQW